MKKRIVRLLVAVLVAFCLACNLVIDRNGIGRENDVMISEAAQNSQAMEATATVR